MQTVATTWVNAQVTLELEKRVRLLAAQRRTSKSEILRQALAKFVETEEKREVKRDANEG